MDSENYTPYHGTYWQQLAQGDNQTGMSQTMTPWRRLSGLYEQEQKNPQRSMFDTIVREGEYLASAGLNGLSQGYSDEIEGAMTGLGYGIANAGMRAGRNMGFNIRAPQESFSEAFARGYQKGRDYRRGVLAEARQNSPYLSGAMESVGSVVSPLNNIFRVSKAAPLAKRAQTNFNNAIATGAIAGYGNADSNDLREVGANVALGVGGNVAGNKLTNTLYGRGESTVRRNVITDLTNRSLNSVVSSFLPPERK